MKSDLKFAEEEMKEIEIKDEVSDEDCEKCGNAMVYKMGRFGKFLAAQDFRIAGTRNRSLRILVLLVRNVRKAISLNAEVKKAEFSLAVTSIRL